MYFGKRIYFCSQKLEAILYNAYSISAVFVSNHIYVIETNRA